MQIIYSGQYLIKQRLDHSHWTFKWTFVLFAWSMVFNYMLEFKKIVLWLGTWIRFFCTKLTHKSCSAKSDKSHTFLSWCDRKTPCSAITFGCFSSRSNFYNLVNIFSVFKIIKKMRFTAISRHALVERPAPSICLRAYSLGSILLCVYGSFLHEDI